MHNAEAVTMTRVPPRAVKRSLSAARSMSALRSLVHGTGLMLGLPLLAAITFRAVDGRGFTVAHVVPVCLATGLLGTLVLFHRHSPRGERLPGRLATGREAGMTLIELVIVLMIMPLIIGAVSYAFVEVISQQNTVSSSLSESADSQVASSTYVTDVETAASLTTDPQVNSSANLDQCGSVGMQLLGLEWNFGAATQTYQTVVSYDVVPQGSNYTLTRYYCSSGYSLTPTTSTTVASDVCVSPSAPPFAPAPPYCPSSAPALKAILLTPTGPASSSVTMAAASGWIATQGVTGVSLPVTEPGTKLSGSYQYSLAADPLAGQQEGVVGSVAPPPATSCGFATPTTGTYTRNLCFMDFGNINFAAALSTSGKGCQSETEGISGTPFTISFCLQWTPVVGGNSSLDAVPIPTYASPPVSEAFLGTNGFYEGIPGDSALYQQVEGSKTKIMISNISVTDSSGQAATGWQLVTGDAESTDPNESIMWSTCPSISNTSSTNPFYVTTGASCTSGDPVLNLLNNTPTSPFGNACLDPGVASPPSYAAGIYLTGVGTTSVECGATVSSDKTGTVMLEASSPSTLSIYLDGSGLEGAFIGVLLP